MPPRFRINGKRAEDVQGELSELDNLKADRDHLAWPEQTIKFSTGSDPRECDRGEELKGGGA